jgi:hypothetical protein
VIHGRVPAPHLLFLLLGRSDGGVGRVNSYSTLAPNGHISGPHDLDWLLVRGGALKGNNILCYVSRESSSPAFLGVPFLSYYAHANEVPRAAFAPAHLSSPVLLNEPADNAPS